MDSNLTKSQFIAKLKIEGKCGGYFVDYPVSLRLKTCSDAIENSLLFEVCSLKPAVCYLRFRNNT